MYNFLHDTMNSFAVQQIKTEIFYSNQGPFVKHLQLWLFISKYRTCQIVLIILTICDSYSDESVSFAII